jgi:hypothetical protein
LRPATVNVSAGRAKDFAKAHIVTNLVSGSEGGVPAAMAKVSSDQNILAPPKGRTKGCNDLEGPRDAALREAMAGLARNIFARVVNRTFGGPYKP